MGISGHEAIVRLLGLFGETDAGQSLSEERVHRRCREEFSLSPGLGQMYEAARDFEALMKGE